MFKDRFGKMNEINQINYGDSAVFELQNKLSLND